jgi:hypothetical protein
VEIFKNIADDVNSEFLNETNKLAHNKNLNMFINEHTRELISGIFFGQNNIIILKKTFDELSINKRKYRFESNL